MSPTVSLSTRVSPQVRDRLAAAAAERGVPLATYTRTLLDGAGAPAAPGDGPVCNEVECLFSGFGPEAGIRREVALALARIVEAGGAPAIAASKELLYQVHTAEGLFEPEEDDDPADVEAALAAAGLGDDYA
jgi:hypothetical protein